MAQSDTPIARVTARIEQAIKDRMARCTREKFWVTHYGANGIHPKHFYWIVVLSDGEKQRLEGDLALMAELRGLLDFYGYPNEGRSVVHIGFESQETVKRESGGASGTTGSDDTSLPDRPRPDAVDRARPGMPGSAVQTKDNHPM